MEGGSQAGGSNKAGLGLQCYLLTLAKLDQHLHTSTGRKFALVEGLSHDLVCTGSNYHVHFAWQVWHGQYSPGFKFNKLKSFSRVERICKKDSSKKGFAVGRIKKHNFCPASVLVLKAGTVWYSHIHKIHEWRCKRSLS